MSCLLIILDSFLKSLDHFTPDEEVQINKIYYRMDTIFLLLQQVENNLYIVNP